MTDKVAQLYKAAVLKIATQTAYNPTSWLGKDSDRDALLGAIDSLEYTRKVCSDAAQKAIEADLEAQGLLYLLKGGSPDGER